MTWTVDSCAFANNVKRNLLPQGSSTMAYGGGLHNMGTGLTVQHCLFDGNLSYAGGGLFSWIGITVLDCEFHGNDAISYNGPVGSLGDWGGGMGVPPVAGSLKGPSSVEWSCVQGLLAPIPGEDPPNPADFPGSLDQDPLFVDAALGDLRLASGSPCIDAGNNGLVPADLLTDIDGLQRFHDDPATADTGVGSAPIVDMGSHEFGSGPPSSWTDLGLGLAGSAGVKGFAASNGLLGVTE